MVLEEKYIIIESTIVEKTGIYFKQIGYRFSEKKNDKDEKMKSIDFYFENVKKERELILTYIPFDLRGNINEWMCPFISIINSNSIYSIENILKHEKIEYNADSFYLLNYKGSFKQQTEQFCDFMIDLFENHLKDWIIGEKWEYIPFDWGTYK